MVRGRAVRVAGLSAPRHESLERLLGGRSSVSSSRSRVGCSLGGITSSGSGVSSGIGSRSGFRCRSRSGLGSHRSGSGCGSRLLLLATGGQSGSSDQGGDDERLVHFRFSLRTVKKTKNATTSSLLQPGSALAESAPAEHIFNSTGDYIAYSSILNNTEHRVNLPGTTYN